MKKEISSKIEAMLAKGIRVANPASVEIGDEVDIGRISGDGVVIHTGCKIFGSSTLILQGTKVGYEGPVTIANCQVGPNVELKAGFFKDAVFLEQAVLGSGSHVREGTILEEQARIAHTVGLKHTILFPFVTLGSLINFCDCLMAGGTSRQDHSEVGSAYIHFNYTPRQDKATPSLIGDVPRGVMLNQKPIFLGGQGGMVGPCRLAFGTVVAAGAIIRQDELRPGRLVFGEMSKSGNIPYKPGRPIPLKRVVVNNINYIANLMALMQWYLHVRALFVAQHFPAELYAGLKANLNLAIAERITRLKAFYRPGSEGEGATPRNGQDAQSSCSADRRCPERNGAWPQLEEVFERQKHFEGNQNLRDSFLKSVEQGITRSGKTYIAVIQGLKKADSEVGTQWLQGIVDHITDEALQAMPSYR
ncbi:MAG: protein GlmU [Desulfobacterales bacterium]|nr:MAG: protein GlmU [Desulfobacterales bacterium]